MLADALWTDLAATCEVRDRVAGAGSLGTPLAHWHNPVRLDPSIEVSLSIADLPPYADIGRTDALIPPTHQGPFSVPDIRGTFLSGAEISRGLIMHSVAPGMTSACSVRRALTCSYRNNEL